MRKHFYLFCAYLGITSCYSLKTNDLNACVRKVEISEQLEVTQQQFVVECCPNHFEDDGRCKECSPGTFGKDCKVPCLANHFGFLCKEMCNCSGNMKCDPVNGCVCKAGLTGPDCIQDCLNGHFGNRCENKCVCVHANSCDSITGTCSCSAGWHGTYCIQECPNDMYGDNCNTSCNCSVYADCDSVSGTCTCHEGFVGEMCALQEKQSRT